MWYLNKIKGQAILAQPFDFNGSAGRTRTCDKVVNSHLLYQLSYRGSLRSLRPFMSDAAYIKSVSVMQRQVFAIVQIHGE